MNDKIKINAIDKPEKWFDIEAKVVDLWEPTSDAISQVGLLGDETGSIKFISWKKSNLPKVEKDRIYQIYNAVTSSWNGNLELNFNSKTKIEKKGEEVKVVNNDKITGKIVSLSQRTEAILRCPACNRTLVDGLCVVHCEVEPKKDIRIGLVVSNGICSKVIETSGSGAEKIAGLSVEDLHALPQHEMFKYLEKRLKGKGITAAYSVLGNILYAKNIEIIKGD